MLTELVNRPMPHKVHSSARIQHCSHPDLTAHSISSNPLHQHSSSIHSTTHNPQLRSRSKGNLVLKKRPLGLTRNSTSVVLTKSTTSSHAHPRKAPAPTPRRPPKRGAFKGALDPDLYEDPDDQHDLQSSQPPAPPNRSQKEDEAWVSESSTRAATPTPQQEPHTPTASAPLGLQLPNPLSSPSLLPLQPCPRPPPSIASPPPADHSTPTPNQMHDAALNPQQDPPSGSRGRSMNRTQSPVEPPNPMPLVIQPKEGPRANVPPDPTAPPQPLEHQHTLSSPRQSPLRKGKGKTPPIVPQKPKRSSINSVRSLSSLALFHNDLLVAQNPSRPGLKHVDSVGSVVLPPKVDTTEAVITMNSKGTYHPTLNAISDLPSEQSQPFSNPPSYSTEPHSSKLPPRLTSDLSKHTLPSKQSPPLPSGSRTPSAPLELSECTRRLQRYSNQSRQAHYLNLKGATDSSTGLISSLLSPQLSFKSRQVQTPSTYLGNGSGYFDSFKSLVGMSSLASESTKVDGAPDYGNQPSAGASPPGRPSTYSESSKSVAMSSSLPKDNKININQNLNHSQRHHFVGAPAKLAIPKPVVPGFITTCGPNPVVSKFLGPRPVLSSNHTETSHSPNISFGQSQGWNTERMDKTEEEANHSTPSLSLHTPTTLGNRSGSPNTTRKSGADSTGSLSRIQKKLLMERDRPISPTLYEQLNHHTTTPEFNNQSSVPGLKTSRSPSLTRMGRQIVSGGSSGGTLPPPSYLIRSLGGQTGPLPFIPLNLLPSTQPSTTQQLNISQNQNTTPTAPMTKMNATTSHEKKNTTTTSVIQQSRDTNLIITPSTPTLTQPQETSWFNGSSEVGRLNEPALKAKQTLSIKLWRNSLIDEVEQILTDHESNTRFRNPLIESLQRTFNFHHDFSS